MRNTQHQRVGLSQHVVQPFSREYLVNAEFFGGPARACACQRDDVHAETSAHDSDPPTDFTSTDDCQSLAGQLIAAESFPVMLALFGLKMRQAAGMAQ